MRYKLAERVNASTEVLLGTFDDFKEARHYVVELLEQDAYHIVGYHLTEVHNAPLHAEIFGAKLDAHCILTISEAE